MEAYGNKVLVNELIILYLNTQARGKEQDTEPETMLVSIDQVVTGGHVDVWNP